MNTKRLVTLVLIGTLVITPTPTKSVGFIPMVAAFVAGTYPGLALYAVGLRQYFNGLVSGTFYEEGKTKICPAHARIPLAVLTAATVLLARQAVVQ